MLEAVTPRAGLESRLTGARVTLSELTEYNPERHIPVDEAYRMIGNSGESRLNPEKLAEAMAKGQIHVYTYTRKGKTEQYLDRLDIGRLYHEPRERVGVAIEPFFAPKDGSNPLDQETYVRRHLQLKDKDGKVVFDMPDAEFPESWDDTSAKIVADKYFYEPKDPEQRKKLEAVIGAPHEHSIRHLVDRVSAFFTEHGKRYGFFATDQDAENFRNELRALQIQRKAAFNSPVQFNAGIEVAYGISGSRSLSYWRNPETGEVVRITDGEYVHPQCHACFIIGPDDNLESILQHGVYEGGIFSAGSGVGQDIGALREINAPLSGGGKASGPMGFLKHLDSQAGIIKSGGKSRRAARMTTMRSYHPDIVDFVGSKVNEDKKALDLMGDGYSPGMDGEAATTVAFQNTNISVRMTDEDFENVRNGGYVELRSVVGDRAVGRISADELLRRISFGAWRVGDPAVQYETKIQEMHTCKNSGRQNSTNPCSEYSFLNDTSCNLASLNVLAFCDENGNLNVEAFMRASRVISIALDIANDAASYPVEKIAKISPEFRTIGLGYANIGAWLMRRGLAYDSDEGRSLVGALTAAMTGAAYRTSTELAERLSPFVHYEFNREHMLEVMEKHRKSLAGLNGRHIPRDLETAAREAWDEVVSRGRVHGFRNAQATVIAPTGTISYLMGCDTTGIEPAIALWVFKDLAGGGTEKLVNKEVPNALRNLGYPGSQITEIMPYIAKHNTVIGAPHVKPEHYTVFDTAFGNIEGIGSIPFEGHIRMLAAAQPFVSGAISKTNNLPEHATVKNIYDGFLLGQELGLKALAVFRNNSKPTTALNFGDRDFRKLGRGEKYDLPSPRPAHEVEISINDIPVHIMVSEYPDGKPGQIVFLSFKAGSDLGALLTTSGIQASRALKRGLTVETIADGWIGHQFNPQGMVYGYPHIRTAVSVLDFAGKFLRLEYLGDVSMATEPEKVDIHTLRGFRNGAFRTYVREKVDDWKFEDVMKDPEYGGFEKPKESDLMGLVQSNGSLLNIRGVPCSRCGRAMLQTAPTCFRCLTCGGSVGGCGL